MNPARFKSFVCIASASALLASCASRQEVVTSPGEVRVTYSTLYPDGSRLKEVPTEVTIVRREATINNVALQVGLNIFMLAMGGGFGMHGFSKDDLRGASIEDAASRDNLKNPVAGTFLSSLQHEVDGFVQQAPDLKSKSFAYPIVVAGGSIRLVYETLADGETERFRLKSDLVVYKRKESSSFLFAGSSPMVDCGAASVEPLALEKWALDNYLPVKTALDDMLASCHEKVAAALPDILKE